MTRPNPQLRPLAVLVPLILTATSPIWAVGGALAGDTGDAPDSYGVATHDIVVDGPYLGITPPDENEQAASLGADADDIANGDDEDGVLDFPDLVAKDNAYAVNVIVSNPRSSDATLIGWIDFDGNGRFDDDEAASATVASGESNATLVLRWRNLAGVSSDFIGDTYARFRIASDKPTSGAATGSLADGEVEDYVLTIQPDVDGDSIPDPIDADNDNDGIPDEVEVIGVDTDGDGTPDSLDGDSDGDGIPDFVEAGPNPATPVDTDGDGTPDFQDLDSNNDGIPDSETTNDTDGDGLPDDVEGAGDADGDGVANLDDLDSDNDSIPDAIEFGGDPSSPVDTDGDGAPDFLDLDSDNDGIPDLYEANSGEFDIGPRDVDRDGRLDSGLVFGPNGLADVVETEAESGIPIFAIADSDGDGIRDFRDPDSDADSINDVSESGLPDADGDGQVDSTTDLNGDGLVDGSNAVVDGQLPDTDGDGVPAFQDGDEDGSTAAPVTGGPVTGGPVDDDPRIETGLSGGAGCSIAGGTGRPDPLFALFALGAVGLLLRRRLGRPFRAVEVQVVEKSTTN